MKEEKRKRVLPHNLAGNPGGPDSPESRTQPGHDRPGERISEVRFKRSPNPTIRVYYDRTTFIPIVVVRCTPAFGQKDVLSTMVRAIDVALATDYLGQSRKMSDWDRMTWLHQSVKICNIGALFIDNLRVISRQEEKRKIACVLYDLKTVAGIPFFVGAKDIEHVGLRLLRHAHVVTTKSRTGSLSTSIPPGEGFESLCRAIWSRSAAHPESEMPLSLPDEFYRLTNGSLDKLARVANQYLNAAVIGRTPGSPLTAMDDDPALDARPDGPPRDNP